MTRTLLERCLTKWLEDADPTECVDLVEAIHAHLSQPQGEPVAYIRRDQLQKAALEPLLCELTPEPRQDRVAIYTHPAHTDEDVQSILRNRRVEFSEYEAHVRRILGVPA